MVLQKNNESKFGVLVASVSKDCRIQNQIARGDNIISYMSEPIKAEETEKIIYSLNERNNDDHWIHVVPCRPITTTINTSRSTRSRRNCEAKVHTTKHSTRSAKQNLKKELKSLLGDSCITSVNTSVRRKGQLKKELKTLLKDPGISDRAESIDIRITRKRKMMMKQLNDPEALTDSHRRKRRYVQRYGTESNTETETVLRATRSQTPQTVEKSSLNRKRQANKKIPTQLPKNNRSNKESNQNKKEPTHTKWFETIFEKSHQGN